MLYWHIKGVLDNEQEQDSNYYARCSICYFDQWL